MDCARESPLYPPVMQSCCFAYQQHISILLTLWQAFAGCQVQLGAEEIGEDNVLTIFLELTVKYV